MHSLSQRLNVADHIICSITVAKVGMTLSRLNKTRLYHVIDGTLTANAGPQSLSYRELLKFVCT